MRRKKIKKFKNLLRNIIDCDVCTAMGWRVKCNRQKETGGKDCKAFLTKKIKRLFKR